jgi:hypothetical protein
MKNFQIWGLGLAVLTVVLASCNGSTGLTSTGTQCPPDYKPVVLDTKPTESDKVIEWDRLTDALAIGDYVETSALLYYVDNQFGPVNNFRVAVSDVRDEKTGQINPTTTCVRYIRRGLEGVGASVEGVSHMIIDNNKAVAKTETKNFSVQIDAKGKLSNKTTPPQEKPGADPGGIFNKPQLQRSFIYNVDNTNYEIRAQGTTDRGTFYLSVKLQKKALPACPLVSPIVMNIPDTDPKKVAWQKAGELMPPGTYEEVSTNLFYQEKKAGPAFSMQVKDEKRASDGAMFNMNVCARNVRADLKNMTMVTDSVTKLVVNEDKSVKTESEPRRFSFGTFSAPAPAGQLTAKFGKVQPDQDVSADAKGTVRDVVAYKINDTDYEVRSVGDVQADKQAGTYYLSVVLRKKP